jgi:hypothetical protein
MSAGFRDSPNPSPASVGFQWSMKMAAWISRP